MLSIRHSLSDFRMTLLAFAAGSILGLALFALMPAHSDLIILSILLTFSLFGFGGLIADFRRLRLTQDDFVRQQRELILQATLFTLVDSSDDLQRQLQHLSHRAENGELPDLHALNQLQTLLQAHTSRLQHLGNMGVYSQSSFHGQRPQQAMNSHALFSDAGFGTHV